MQIMFVASLNQSFCRLRFYWMYFRCSFALQILLRIGRDIHLVFHTEGLAYRLRMEWDTLHNFACRRQKPTGERVLHKIDKIPIRQFELSKQDLITAHTFLSRKNRISVNLSHFSLYVLYIYSNKCSKFLGTPYYWHLQIPTAMLHLISPKVMWIWSTVSGFLQTSIPWTFGTAIDLMLHRRSCEYAQHGCSVFLVKLFWWSLQQLYHFGQRIFKFFTSGMTTLIYLLIYCHPCMFCLKFSNQIVIDTMNKSVNYFYHF